MLVAVQIPKGEEFAATVADLWLHGDAVLPLDAHLPEPETEKLLATFRPAALVHHEGRDALSDPLSVGADVAAVILTSGSTGLPKGVEISIGALRAAAVMSHKRLEIEVGDRWLCCLPLHHIAGFGILVRSSLLDSAPEILDRFKPKAVAKSDATHVSLVPTQLKRLLDEEIDLKRFKTVLLGGAAIPADLVRRAEDAGAKIVRSYGMTETCGGVVYDGVALDGVEVRLDTDGRIQIKSPTLMLRYRNDPALTESVLDDGWLTTSDQGRFSQGRLEVVGRTDDLINTGGEKVSPAEVEALLADHPLIDEAVVIGIEDDEWGESVVAVAVPLDLNDVPTVADIRAFLRDKVASYKLPQDIVLTAAIPRTASGKVDVATLRMLLGV